MNTLFVKDCNTVFFNLFLFFTKLQCVWIINVCKRPGEKVEISRKSLVLFEAGWHIAE